MEYLIKWIVIAGAAAFVVIMWITEVLYLGAESGGGKKFSKIQIHFVSHVYFINSFS